MIRKIIKNRREIAMGAMMVSVVYVAIVINSVRTVYGKDTTFGRNN